MSASRRLILNADDFGYEPNVTRGIVEAMHHGLVSSTTMMVNTPYSAEAARVAQGLAVGLHLNLARWNAVSNGVALEEAHAATYTAEFVEAETAAQLARLHQLIGKPATHIDVHKHLHHHDAILEGLCRAARAAQVPVRSIHAGMRQRIRAAGVRTNDGFVGDAGSAAYWTAERFEADLSTLPQTGVIELMCHPGYTPALLKSGYSAQRETELATFTSPYARAVAQQQQVEFVSWADAFR